jgi:hypothetical protein
MLAARPDGRVEVRMLKFANAQGQRGIFDQENRDVSGEVEFAVYGPHIVKDGQVNVEAMADQVDDLRHLFRFPMFERGGRQIHLPR